MPGGLLGKLTGIPLCPVDAGIAGTCGGDSLVGSALAHVGAGKSMAAFPGRVYLTAPPNSDSIAGLSIVIPAVAGPLNFGTVVQTAAVVLRKSDFGLDVTTSDFPRFQQGIPVFLRDVTLTIDKKGFLINPTTCNPLKFLATFTGFEGSVASSESPFQATGCGDILFRPDLTTTVGDSANNKKNTHPPFSTVLTVPAGDAANKKVTVTLPKDFSVNLAGLTSLCSQAQFDSKSCPAASKFGSVNAVSSLLPEALNGDVYLVAQTGGALPKLSFT